MAYYIDLFSPETYEAFSNSDRSVSGFRARHEGLAKRIIPGDTLVCYVTKLSRWVGLLTVDHGPYKDDSPIFTVEDDPFTIRFKVTPSVWLELDKANPIHDEEMWEGLSFTRGLPQNSTAWTGKVRGSLVRLEEADGEFVAHVLRRQASQPVYLQRFGGSR
jgi:predicted RNA-binding protein